MSHAPVSDPSHGFFIGASVEAERQRAGVAYLEHFRTGLLSLGLDVLEPGPGAALSTHSEDEVYVVMEGAARFEAGGGDRAVGAGDVLYVRRGVGHRFHGITERMRIVVVFCPPHESLGR